MLLNSCKNPIIPSIFNPSRHSCEKPMVSFLPIDDVKTSNNFSSHKIKAVIPLRHAVASIASDSEAPVEERTMNGIGITKYFQGRNVFITGATGMLGKVLVEKLLRSTGVGKIYILVRVEDEEAALNRITKELMELNISIDAIHIGSQEKQPLCIIIRVINSELFKSLRQKHGKDYESFIREKLIPVAGNITDPEMGIDSQLAHEIREEIDVIIESAAITTLNERYDVILNANVNGPLHMMKFAKTCRKLELLVHISTAFVNGLTEGTILEDPLKSKSPKLDVSEEIEMAFKSSTASSNYDFARQMKRIGMERARHYDYYNTYHLSKAMAEMAIDETRGDIPVLIVRPSVIESCLKDPIPGWIEGKRMFDPYILSYGRGQLPAFLGNPCTTMDVMPLDMVVNGTIAAIAKHGSVHLPELNVYQITSSTLNPLTFFDFFEYLHDYFSREPLIELENFSKICFYDEPERIKFFDNYDDFSKYTREEISRRLGINNSDGLVDKRTQILRRQSRAQATYTEQISKVGEFIGFFKARFHAGNTQQLLTEMSPAEQENFEFDVRKIDWKTYIQQVHIPGLRKHVLRDKLESHHE